MESFSPNFYGIKFVFRTKDDLHDHNFKCNRFWIHKVSNYTLITDKVYKTKGKIRFSEKLLWWELKGR